MQNLVSGVGGFIFIIKNYTISKPKSKSYKLDNKEVHPILLKSDLEQEYLAFDANLLFFVPSSWNQLLFFNLKFFIYNELSIGLN